VDFTPVEPRGLSDRELQVAVLEAVQRTHECVHRMERDVRNLRSEFSGFEEWRGIIERRLGTFAQALGIEKKARGEKVRASWRGQPMWKIIVGALGSVGGAVMLIQITAPAVVAGAKAFWAALMAAH
jgi:hypothetical protein